MYRTKWTESELEFLKQCRDTKLSGASYYFVINGTVPGRWLLKTRTFHAIRKKLWLAVEAYHNGFPGRVAALKANPND